MGGFAHLCMVMLVISVGLAHNAWAENTNVGIFGTGSALWPDCPVATECYLPGEVVIISGDTVTWINKDETVHTVTGGIATLEGPNYTIDSHAIHAGETFSHVFESTGEYPYFCVIHPWMGGDVIVVDHDDTEFGALYAPAGLDVYAHASGVFAYVIGPQNTLSTINITDISNPALTATVHNKATFDSPRGPFDVQIYDTSGMAYAVITDGDRGHASIINVTDPTLPVRIQTAWQNVHDHNMSEQVTDIEIFTKSDGVYALMGKFYTDAVHIVNMTDPVAPNTLALLQNGRHNIDAIGHPNDIEVYETAGKIYAMISGHHNTLQIVDVTEPDTPKGVAGLGSIQNATDVQYGWHVAAWVKPDGVYGAVTNYYNNTVKIMDITDPQMPRTTHEGFDTIQRPGDIKIHTDAQQTYAIILGGIADSGGLHIVDISDPYMPVSLGMSSDNDITLESPRDMELLEWNDDTYVIVASAGGDAIHIIEITEPDNPKLISSAQNRAIPDT